MAPPPRRDLHAILNRLDALTQPETSFEARVRTAAEQLPVACGRWALGLARACQPDVSAARGCGCTYAANAAVHLSGSRAVSRQPCSCPSRCNRLVQRAHTHAWPLCSLRGTRATTMRPPWRRRRAVPMWSSLPAALRAWGTMSPCAQHWVSGGADVMLLVDHAWSPSCGCSTNRAIAQGAEESSACQCSGVCNQLHRSVTQAAARACQRSSTSATSS